MKNIKNILYILFFIISLASFSQAYGQPHSSPTPDVKMFEYNEQAYVGITKNKARKIAKDLADYKDLKELSQAQKQKIETQHNIIIKFEESDSITKTIIFKQEEIIARKDTIISNKTEQLENCEKQNQNKDTIIEEKDKKIKTKNRKLTGILIAFVVYVILTIGR